MRLRTLIASLILLMPVAPVFAQQSREGTLREQRSKKSEQLTEYKPGTLERWLLRFENERLLERVFTPSDGFYPRIGTFTRGGGIAFGPGFKRRALLGEEVDFVASSAVSFKKYWVAEAALLMPRLGGGRGFAEVHGRQRDMPQEDYFGLGPGSIRGNRVDYLYRDTEIGGSGGVRLTPWLAATGGLRWLHPRIGSGDDPRFPSIETRFTDADSPGLAVQPDFLVYEIALDLNYTDTPGNPRSGGHYRVAYDLFDDRDLERYSFDRVDIDLRQYVPFFKQRRVIALRSFISLSEADTGNEVPFYLQRTLGGWDTLRGFREFRFRDENLLLFQGEYRWEIFPALDAAIFYDAGKVASDRRDLDLNDLESDYGFGFRFGTIAGVFLRIDAGFGSSEGKHLFIGGGRVF